MKIETPGDTEDEAPPPLGIFVETPPETEFYDQWGNLKGPPVKTIEETHGENFIKIFVYQYTSINTVACGRETDYFFGFQIKIDKLIRQKRANIASPPMRNADEARLAAQKMIVDICRKNKAAKRMADFQIISYNQPELF